MKNNIALYCGIVCFLLVATCTKQDIESPRNNPFDANGDSWTINSSPVILAPTDSLPLWYDFDFSDNTGSVLCNAIVRDNNGNHDTVKTVFAVGENALHKDTIQSTVDSTFVVSHLKPATTYYYSIYARDKFDSSTSFTGSFTTPTGTPPRLVDSVSVLGGSYGYIAIKWYKPILNITYLVYRALSPKGPWFLITNTMITSSYYDGTYSDYVNDYKTYYYCVSVLNGYGECRSKKVLDGYLYNSNVSVPYSVSATKGTYPEYIYLSWSVPNYATSTVFIKRSKSSYGPFELIDSVKSNYFYQDSVNESNISYYYQLSVRDSQGRRSGPSSSEYGYISGMPAPGSLSASQGSYFSYVSLSWNTIAAATGYYVYRSIQSNGTYQRIAIVPNSSYSSYSTQYYSDSVKTTDDYYYKVAAYTASGKVGTQSNYVLGYLQRPVAPSITVSKGSSTEWITVSWAVNYNAKKYYIYRSYLYNSVDSLKLIDSTSLNTYADSTIKTTGNYYYAVAMVDSANRISSKSYTNYGYISNIGTPYSLAASSTYTNYIKLTWYNSTSVSGYYIYRSNSEYGTYVKIDSTKSTSYSDSTIVIDTATIGNSIYYYQIQAYTSSGKTGNMSGAFYGALKGLSYPDKITATTNTYKSKIIVKWDLVSRATGYTVYRSTSSYGTFVKIGTVTNTSYTDTPVVGGNVFYYTVASVKGASVTAQSSAIRGSLLIPPTLKNTKSSSFSAALSWTWSVTVDTTIKGYYVYRSTDSVNFVRIAVQTPFSVSSYNDAGIVGVKYYYQISAFSSFDESAYSNCIMSMTTPLVPRNFLAQENKGTVTLSWDSVATAQSYRVYRGTTSTGLVLLDSVKAITKKYVDATSKSYSTYYYAVAAVNLGGESFPTQTISVQITPAIPQAPVNVLALSSASGVTVTWSTSLSVVTGYTIYRSLDSGITYLPIGFTSATGYTDPSQFNILCYYKVSATNSGGESAKSSVVTGKVLVPATPLSLAVGLGSAGTIYMSWQMSTGASGYYIYRSILATGTFTKLSQSQTLSYSDITATPGTVYYYKITAFNPAGESAMSDYISGIVN